MAILNKANKLYQKYRAYSGKVQFTWIAMLLLALMANLLFSSHVTALCVASDGTMELKLTHQPCGDATEDTCPGVPSPVNPHEAGLTTEGDCCADVPLPVDPFLSSAPIRLVELQELSPVPATLFDYLLTHHHCLLPVASVFSDIPPPYYTDQTWSCIKSILLIL